MTTPRKYLFEPGPRPDAACTILSVDDPGTLARDIRLVILSDCCGMRLDINYQGMVGRILRGTGLCWRCANHEANVLKKVRKSHAIGPTDAVHEDFINPPTWGKPASVPTGYWLWGR